ncbi:hypothetical protein JHW43_005836 [Diplocarpon mali]|nr:hypothetical protein JHW43_005836 [Diplocarpon mali]
MASLIRRVQGCFPLTYYDLSDYPLTVEQKKWAQEGERIVRCRECSHYRCAACYDVEANDEISHRCNGDERAKLPSSSVIPTSSGEPKPSDRRGPLAEEGPARKRRASAQLGRFGQPAGPSQAEGSGQAGTYYQFGGQNQAGPFAPFEEPSHFNRFEGQNQAGAFAPFGGPSYFNRFEGQNQAGAFALFGGPSQTREPGQGGALTQFEVLNQAGAFTPVELPTLLTQSKGPNKAGVLAPVRVPSHANQFGGPNQTWKTKGQGHNFAGFAHPFGMVKLGPDLVDGTDSCSGYLPNGNFSGFSMMHEQGTGGAAKYGTVAQPPLIGNISSPLSSITIGRIVPDQGSVGYYRAQTSEQVVVELAATSRAGMYQYAFPASDGIGGFSNATPSTANVFKGPAAAGSVRQTPRFANSSSSIDYISGFSTFDAPFVSSKVGISWISVKKACQNVNDQIPAGTKFSAVYIRSMIEIWRFDGHLPAGRSSNYNGRTQGGSNADNVLADAYVMGVRGGVNWNDGYAAMVKDAEVTPPNTNPLVPMAPDASTKEGRGALPDWLQYDFITPTYTRTVSRAVEYAYNDFSLYQISKGLGRPEMLQGFIEVDELNSKSYWGEAYCQSSAWGYSWAGVHDMGKIIDLIGGANTTLRRLEMMFSIGADLHRRKGIIYDATDEPIGQCIRLVELRSETTQLAYKSLQETAMRTPCKHGFSGIVRQSAGQLSMSGAPHELAYHRGYSWMVYLGSFSNSIHGDRLLSRYWAGGIPYSLAAEQSHNYQPGQWQQTSRCTAHNQMALLLLRQLVSPVLPPLSRLDGSL